MVSDNFKVVNINCTAVVQIAMKIITRGEPMLRKNRKINEVYFTVVVDIRIWRDNYCLSCLPFCVDCWSIDSLFELDSLLGPDFSDPSV